MITRSERRRRKFRARQRKDSILRSMEAHSWTRDWRGRPIDERDFPWIGRGPRYSKGRVGRSNSPVDSFGFVLKYNVSARADIAERMAD